MEARRDTLAGHEPSMDGILSRVFDDSYSHEGRASVISCVDNESKPTKNTTSLSALHLARYTVRSESNWFENSEGSRNSLVGLLLRSNEGDHKGQQAATAT